MEGNVKTDLDFSGLKVRVKGDFATEWGQGKKHVSRDLFQACKKSAEDLYSLPTSRMEELPFDSYRCLIGKDFRYAFSSLLTKKRSRDSDVHSANKR